MFYAIIYDVAGNTVTSRSSSSPLTIKTDPALVTSISLSTTQAIIGVNETTTVTATVSPSTAANKDLTWSISGSGSTISSSTTSSATVKGVTEFTKVTLTATAKDGSGKTASCTVSVPKNFTYTGNIQSFTLPAGKYKFEAWGAQGGCGLSAQYGKGGCGSYSWTDYNVSVQTKVFIVVGGAGYSVDSYVPSTSRATLAGGYNGGGVGYAQKLSNNNHVSSSGGGATHVASISGVLSSLSNSVNKIWLVAGGGGGGHYGMKRWLCRPDCHPTPSKGNQAQTLQGERVVLDLIQPVITGRILI